jgi:hypothetical protein
VWVIKCGRFALAVDADAITAAPMILVSSTCPVPIQMFRINEPTKVPTRVLDPAKKNDPTARPAGINTAVA